MMQGMYRILALLIGFLLDQIFGDPERIPHPVVLIGRLIAALEKKIRPRLSGDKRSLLLGGALEVFLTILVVFGLSLGVLRLAWHFCPPAGFVLECLCCGHLLAARSLKRESMRVYTALKEEGLDAGRASVARIVGRDTQKLTEEGVLKAAVETVAENTSDGVTAPLFWMALGGAPLMFFYKAVNTMDSMLGYKNEKYRYFGRCAAKLDDVVNLLPARITGLMMVLAAFILGMNGKNAWRIFRRDRYKHASPNSAQTESAMAGALELELAGDASYFGEVHHKPTIGDPIRRIEAEDIKRANRLMLAASILCLLLFCILLLLWNLR